MWPTAAVSAVLAWALFAFGGYYTWAVIPIIVACGVLAAAPGFSFGVPEDARRLDRLLVTFLLCAALQLLPLPYALIARIDPAAVAFRAAFEVDYPLQLAAGGPRPDPVSLAPARTLLRIGLAAASVLLFWVVRAMAEGGGERRLVRMIAWMGTLVTLVMIVQRASAADRLYGVWEPPPHVAPLGPILNRNHFATWMLLALPLSAGYIMARIERRRRAGSGTLSAIVSAVDVRQIWLVAAGCLMTLAIFMAESRSGVVGLAAVVVTAIAVGFRRLDWTGRAVAGLYGLLLGAAAAMWANVGILAGRFERTFGIAQDARIDIWRETLPVVRDFWLTGTGLGTYATAMIVYQQTQRDVFFNHAHNQYLHLASEGGLLLAVPFLLALAAFVALAARRLRGDATPLFWVRVGGFAGLAGVAVQSLWETGLRTPANMVLFAVVCALVVAAPRAPRPGPRHEAGTR